MNTGFWYKSSNDKNEVQEDMKKSTSWTFSFKGKIFIFIMAVMLFSCYLYGGNDMKKGAVMAFHEMSEQVTVLSEESPLMKETFEDVKAIYKDAKDFFKTYFNVD